MLNSHMLFQHSTFILQGWHCECKQGIFCPHITILCYLVWWKWFLRLSLKPEGPDLVRVGQQALLGALLYCSWNAGYCAPLFPESVFPCFGFQSCNPLGYVFLSRAYGSYVLGVLDCVPKAQQSFALESPSCTPSSQSLSYSQQLQVTLVASLLWCIGIYSVFLCIFALKHVYSNSLSIDHILLDIMCVQKLAVHHASQPLLTTALLSNYWLLPPLSSNLKCFYFGEKLYQYKVYWNFVLDLFHDKKQLVYLL